MPEPISSDIVVKATKASVPIVKFAWRRWIVPAIFAAKRYLRPRPRKFFGNSFVWGLNVRTSWGEIEHFVREHNAAMQRINPDLVVGTGVGGGILAALIAGNCDRTPYAAVDRETVWVNGVRSVQLFGLGTRAQTRRLIKDKVIFIASAELVSGQTTIELTKLIEEFQPIKIYYICIDLHDVSSIDKPDFFYGKIYSSRKGSDIVPNIIQKPWRILESFRSADEGMRPS